MFSPINKQLRHFPLSDSLSLSLFPRLLLTPFGRDTQLVMCLCSSAEKWQIEMHLAGRARRVIAGYQRLRRLMEKLKRLQNVLF